MSRALALVLLVVVMSAVWAQSATLTPIQLDATVHLLGTVGVRHQYPIAAPTSLIDAFKHLDDGRNQSSFCAISPDGRHMATLLRIDPPKDTPWADTAPCVVSDGVPGTRYDEISYDKAYSPDSTHLFYGARRGKDWYMVVDGQEQGPYDTLDASGIEMRVRFSTDSKHMAYVAMRDGKWCVVKDGVPGPLLDGTLDWRMAFDTTGTRLAYVVHELNKEYLMVDGVPGQRYDAIAYPVFNNLFGVYFTPVGNHLVEVGLLGGIWTVNVEGQKPRTMKDADIQPPNICSGPSHDRHPYFYFSPDGVQMKTVPTQGQGLLDDNYSVSPNLTHVAQWRDQSGNGKVVLMLDGKELQTYEVGPWGNRMNSPTFSPDGTRLAASIHIPQGADLYFPDSWQTVVILDGKEVARPDFASTVLFSPDSKRYAYISGGADTRALIVDGVQVAQVAFAGTSDNRPHYADDSIWFSSDSRHVACALGDSKSMTVFLDGKAVGIAEQVSDVTFSPDGSHLCWTAKQDGIWHIIIDGHPGMSIDKDGYPAVYPSQKVFHFDTPDHVHYLVELHPPTTLERTLYLVDQPL